MATTLGMHAVTGQGGGRMRANSNVNDLRLKPAGVTIDWALVPTNAGGTTLVDGTVVPAGVKFIQAGTVLARITSGGTSGYFAPFTTGASNGTQTLTRGECFILCETVLETDDRSSLPNMAADGGTFYRSRVDPATGTAPQTNPAFAAINTAFPAVTWTED